MERNPDYILFSTGLKPSAPAEKALFLSSEFRRGYYPVFFTDQITYTVYRRKPDYSGEDSYFGNPNFVNHYTEALNNHARKKFDAAYEHALQARTMGPSDFYMPVVLLADIQLNWGNLEKGLNLLYEAYYMSDGYAIQATDKLARYYQMIGDTAAARPFLEKLDRYSDLD